MRLASTLALALALAMVAVAGAAAAPELKWASQDPPGAPTGVTLALAEAANSLRVTWFARDGQPYDSVAGDGEPLLSRPGNSPEHERRKARRKRRGSRQLMDVGAETGGGADDPRISRANRRLPGQPVDRETKFMEDSAPSPAMALPEGVVEYGFSSSDMAHTARASSSRVGDWPCRDRGKPATGCTGADVVTGRFFTADMTALFDPKAPQDVTVHYRVGVLRDEFRNAKAGGDDAGDEPYRWSPANQVTVRSRASNQPVRFTVIGDMGTIENQPNAPRVAAAMTYDNRVVRDSEFLLHVGDMAYAFQDHSRWPQWLTQMKTVLSSVPYMIAVGNRDDMEIIDERWRMPLTTQPPSHRNRMYSFDRRFVHVATFSTIHDFGPGSEQYAWLTSDLREAHAARQAGKTAWIVVMGHTPFYSSSAGHDGGDPKLREHIEPLFAKYGVDIAFFGDDHSYERSWPMANGAARLPTDTWADSTKWEPANLRAKSAGKRVDRFVDATGPGTGATVHMLVGTAGCGLDPWVTPDPPQWSAAREMAHGHTLVSATPTELRVEFVPLAGEGVRDEFVLQSTRNGAVAEHYGMVAESKPLAKGWLVFFVIVALMGAAYYYRQRLVRAGKVRSMGVASPFNVKASVC